MPPNCGPRFIWLESFKLNTARANFRPVTAEEVSKGRRGTSKYLKSKALTSTVKAAAIWLFTARIVSR